MINIPVFQVDAFTDQPFIGNPAAVCLLMEEKSDEWMLNVAREMNCSETAFLLNKEEDIFEVVQPQSRSGLCGHATLASAHVLWEKELFPGMEILFFTKGGLLTAQYKEGWIELNFPAIEEKKVFPSEILLDALKVPVLYVGKSKYDYLVEIETEEILKDMNPDFETLKIAVPRGVIVTCQSDRPEFDFISRFFVPSLGINEDPVTGSAHCVLGPYWQKKLNKSELIAYQASERGGVIKVKIEDDRVYISGKAVTITDGVLLVAVKNFCLLMN